MRDADKIQYWIDIVPPQVPSMSAWWYLVYLICVLCIGFFAYWLITRSRWFWVKRAHYKLSRNNVQSIQSFVVWLEYSCRTFSMSGSLRQQLQQLRYSSADLDVEKIRQWLQCYDRERH